MKQTRLSETTQRLKYVCSDLLTSSIAFFIFNVMRWYLLQTTESVWAYVTYPKLLVEQALIPLGMVGIYWLSGYYNRPFGKSRLQELVTTFFSSLINAGIVYFILLINDQTGRRSLNYELILLLVAVFFTLPYCGRYIITSHAIRHFRDHLWRFRILVVGNSDASRKIVRRLGDKPGRVCYEVVGFLRIPGESEADDGFRVWDLEECGRVCREESVDQLVIATETGRDTTTLNLVYQLFRSGLPVKIAPDTLSYLTSAIRLNDIYAEPFIDLTSPSMSEASKNVKRVLDVVVSSLLLLLMSPIYAALAMAVKCSSKGGAFYSQERLGQKGRSFRIYKFRTMREDAEAGGPMLSEENDPRITPLGRIMRKYRLDELPQFWNVLKGDMSIVGPRPERAYFVDKIVREAPYYTLVWQVRPGITSWGMVKYGYASNVAQMVERTRYDLIYLSNMSLLVDLKILIYTIKTVATGRGI